MDNGRKVIESDWQNEETWIKRLVRRPERHAYHVDFRDHPEAKQNKKNDLGIESKRRPSNHDPSALSHHGADLPVCGPRRESSTPICSTESASAMSSARTDRAEL